MSGDNFLRNGKGQIIGKTDGNWIRDGNGKIVARYDESDNRTRTGDGKIVGSGDQRLIELGRKLTKKK